MEFCVVVDTREQHPWTFRDLKTQSSQFVVSTSRQGLKQGDYAILNAEDEFVVERKSLEDLYGTLASGRERFKRELERISDCCVSGAVVIEADWAAIAAPTQVRSEWHSGMHPSSVIGTIQSWSIRYPKVHWWPMPSRPEAEWTAFQLLRFAFERLQQRLKDAEEVF